MSLLRKFSAVLKTLKKVNGRCINGQGKYHTLCNTGRSSNLITRATSSTISDCKSNDPERLKTLNWPSMEKSCRFYSDSKQDEDTIDSTSVFSLKPADAIEFSDDTTKDLLLEDLFVYEDFLTLEEENSLLSEIEPYMKKLRYEYDHWDDAIHGYRETEKRHWNEANQSIIQRVKDLAFPPDVPEAQLAYVHILDLESKGYIKPHVDSIRFCGSTITGMSLMSDSVMRLTHEQNKDSWAKLLLKQRSLYIMRGVARYQYKHEILGNEHSFYKYLHVPRRRRISVICRNEAADLNGFPDQTDHKRY